MNIFKQAKANKAKGLGYQCMKFKLLWKGHAKSLHWFAISYGIRRSDMWQWFPIWNTSNNCERALMFGLWKLYFELKWHRQTYFNQDRPLIQYRPIRKLYQLFA